MIALTCITMSREQSGQELDPAMPTCQPTPEAHSWIRGPPREQEVRGKAAQ